MMDDDVVKDFSAVMDYYKSLEEGEASVASLPTFHYIPPSCPYFSA